MSWNHRLVYFPRNKVTKLMEVFYDDNGLPWDCSDGSVLHDGVTDDDTTVLDAIKQQLNWMGNAVNEPILNIETDFTGESPKTDGPTIDLSEPGAMEALKQRLLGGD